MEKYKENYNYLLPHYPIHCQYLHAFFSSLFLCIYRVLLNVHVLNLSHKQPKALLAFEIVRSPLSGMEL